MRRLKNFFGNVMGVFILVQLFLGALYVLTHPVEFLSALIAIVSGVFGLWLLVGGPTHIFEQLTSDKKDENTNREVMKGCIWALLGVFLLVLANSVADKKSSSYQSSSTYVREDYSRPTREYSAHKQDYHPIELPKSYKPVEVTAPKLESLPPPLKTDLPRYAPPPVDNIPLPDKSLTQVPVPLSDSEREALIKALLAAHESDLRQREAKLEAARKEPDAQSEPLRNNHAVEPTPTVLEPYYSEPTPYDAYIALEQGRSRTLAPKLFSPRPIMPLSAVAP